MRISLKCTEEHFSEGKPRAAGRHDGQGPSGIAGGALRFALAQNRPSPFGAGPVLHVASREEFFAAYTLRRTMIGILSAEGGSGGQPKGKRGRNGRSSRALHSVMWVWLKMWSSQ